MNEIGIRIVELCDGTQTVNDIISIMSNEFSLLYETMKRPVLDALDRFNSYYAIKWRKKKLLPAQKTDSTQYIPKAKNVLVAPLNVLWDITYSCNLKCQHCLVSANEKSNYELGLEEVKRIIDQLEEMKVFNLCFLGGEPLMREDFFEILEYASLTKIGITFSTNGTLIDDRVINKLANLRLFDVQVSLDGLEETHNKIRGVNSSFQMAIQAIKKLIKSGIRVGVSSTINKLNLHELRSLIQYSISLGATSYKAIPFMPVGRGKKARSLTLSHEEMKEYVASLSKSKKEFRDQIHIYAEETYTWLLEDPPEHLPIANHIKNFSCVAGTSQVVISPTGLVFPCPFLHDFVAGDLRRETMDQIWNNSKVLTSFRQINREVLKGKCKKCPYLPLYCRGGCRAAAYAVTGDIYAEDPFCWYKPEK